MQTCWSRSSASFAPAPPRHGHEGRGEALPCLCVGRRAGDAKRPRQDWYQEADAKVMDAIGKAAALRAAELQPGFQEDYEFEALALLKPGQKIYVPQAFLAPEDYHTRSTGSRWYMDYSQATCEYYKEFDAFPGAGVYKPYAKYQWQSALFEWALAAMLDFLDIFSDVNLAILMITASAPASDKEEKHKGYEAVPMKVRVLFVCISVASLLLEFVTAALEVRERDGKFLRGVYRLHGLPAWAVASGKAVFLRYLNTPSKVENACRHFFPQKDGGYNANTDDWHVPVYVTRCQVSEEYYERDGFLSKIPKTIMEDVILACLNQFIVFTYLGHKQTLASMFSTGMSAVMLLKSVYQGWQFSTTLRGHARWLQQRCRNGDKNSEAQLERLLSHPLRRAMLRDIARPPRALQA